MEQTLYITNRLSFVYLVCFKRLYKYAESLEIGKGGWLGTAELAAAQPMVHVNLNVTMPHVTCRDAYKSPPSLYFL